MSKGAFEVSGLVMKDGEHFLCKYKTYLNEEVEIFHPLDTTIEEVDNEIGTIYKKEDGKYYIKFKKIVTESGKELESVHSGNINPIKLPTALPYLTIFRIETEDFVE
jgi:putative protease